MKKISISFIAFLQALGVIIYCALIASLLWFLGKHAFTPQGFLGTVLMLVLLVFSAAVTGSLVFGYPAYLVLNKRTKEAMHVLFYTLLYCLGIIGTIIIIRFSLIF